MKRKMIVIVSAILAFTMLVSCSTSIASSPIQEDTTTISSFIQVNETNSNSEELSFMELQELHLPEGVERTVARSQYCFIGRYPDTTKYGIFHEKKEIGYIDLGEELILYGAGGIALGKESNKAYVLFYVSSPTFQVKIVEICPKEKIDSVGQGMDFQEYDGPGFPCIQTLNQSYFAIPEKEEWYFLNILPKDGNVSCSDLDVIQVDLIAMDDIEDINFYPY